MAANSVAENSGAEPKPVEEVAHAGDTSQLDLPSPKNADTSAAVSLSLSVGSGGSGKFAMDERLHKWLEEEVSQLGLDDQPKQSGQQQKLHTKILVSNSASGSIIGKVGMNIHHTQSQTGAKIQLSKARQFFPGTNERTLLIRGNLGQIASAIYMIYLRLIDENCAPIILSQNDVGEPCEDTNGRIGTGQAGEASEKPMSKDLGATVASALLQIKLLVPEDLCGIIVGRSGSTVKVFAETTNTSIRLLKPPKVPSPALSHHIVSIRGHLIDIIKAISLIILKQADDPDYQNYGHLPRTYYMYGNSRYSMLPQMAPGMMYMPSYAQPSSFMQGQMVSVTCPLTAEQQQIVLQNMVPITQHIQQMTGILLKLETMQDCDGFSVRLDGARDSVYLASALLHNYVDPSSGSILMPNVAHQSY